MHSTCQEGITNRTEPAEPNRTEPCNFGTGRNRTRNRTEPNRTEPRRLQKKTQAELCLTGKTNCPNRTKPNRTDESRESPEPKRIEPNRLLPDLYVQACPCASLLVSCCWLCKKAGFADMGAHHLGAYLGLGAKGTLGPCSKVHHT